MREEGKLSYRRKPNNKDRMDDRIRNSLFGNQPNKLASDKDHQWMLN